MKKYYLLNCTGGEHTLHVFDTPEERDTTTIGIVGDNDIVDVRKWDTIKRKLADTGAFSTGEISVGWFDATPAKQDTLAIILEKLETIRVASVGNLAEPGLGRAFRGGPFLEPTDSRAAEEPARAPFIPPQPGPPPVPVTPPAQPISEPTPSSINLTGGMTLDGPNAGVWSVNHNGRTLAATKPASRFLRVADDATDGAWLLAAQATLDAINLGQLKPQ